MKNFFKLFFFRLEELSGSGIGFLVRPFRTIAVGVFIISVSIAHHLGDKASVLLTPFLMELGRMALDDRASIWVWRTLVGGAVARLDLTEKTQRNIFLADVYEAGLTRFVASVLRPGDVFVDVGANIGYYTLVAASLVGGSGRVIACEPEEQNFTLLQANVETNQYRQVRLLQTAVGDKAGTVTLHVNPLNRGGNSVLPFMKYKTGTHSYNREQMEQKYGGDTLEQKVEMRTLDDILEAEHISSVRVMKIDVEGFEEAVFKGMEKMLERKSVEYILCEIGSGSARSVILEIMKSIGYTPCRIDAKGVTMPITTNFPRDILFVKQTYGG